MPQPEVSDGRQAPGDKLAAFQVSPGQPAGLGRSGLCAGAIILLAVLASLTALSWARAAVVPVLLGLTFSYALTPVVKRLVGWHRRA